MYPEEVLDRFDFVMANIHGRFKPDWMAHQGRPGYDIDVEKVLRACTRHGVAVEIKAHPWRLDLDWRWHQTALDFGCMMSINPDDASLVLTETDFLDRLSFDSPLDIKFRADALGRTILFIGYSMSDPNIRLLLHSIWQTWEKSGHKDDRPPSFVFMPASNPVQEAILAHWGITLLTPRAEAAGVTH